MFAWPSHSWTLAISAPCSRSDKGRSDKGHPVAPGRIWQNPNVPPYGVVLEGKSGCPVSFAVSFRIVRAKSGCPVSFRALPFPAIKPAGPRRAACAARTAHVATKDLRKRNSLKSAFSKKGKDHQLRKCASYQASYPKRAVGEVTLEEDLLWVVLACN